MARLWTSTPDRYPLTDLGRRQAAETAAALAAEGIGVVYTSAILRARQTAAVIAARLSAELVQVDGLEEMHVGVHEGGHDDDVGPVAAAVFRGWLADGDLDHGFEGGETGRAVVDRFGAALRGIIARHPDDTVAVVSHGGVMAVGLAVLCDNLSPRFVASNLIGNAAVIEVVADGDAWRCASWAGLPPA